MIVEKLVPFIDFKPNTESVDDQVKWGSCVAHAGQTLLEIAFNRANSPIDLSRMYLYYYVQKYAGTLGTIDGGYPNQLGNILAAHGIAKESVWEYDPSKLGVEPSDSAKQDARSIIPIGSTSFTQISTLRNIKVALNKGQPVVFAMFMHPSLNNLQGKDWRKHSWNTDEQPLGMHAVTVIGYDDSVGRFLCENSWGPNWGDGGFFGIPYEYFGAKSVLQAFTFTKLPIPFVPVVGYEAPGPVTFSPDTMIIEIPSIDYYPGNLAGSIAAQGIVIKLKDPGILTLNGDRYVGEDTPYYLAKTMSGQRHLGFPEVWIGNTKYEKVLLVNPDFDLVSINNVG